MISHANMVWECDTRGNGNVITDGMGMTDQMEWECHIIPVWYGNVIPDGIKMSYQMEWECDTRWNGNVIPMWYENVIPDGMGIPWDHTMEMKPYHTMWNHTIPDHTIKMESWSHTIPWEWNLCRISPKLGQVE